MRKTKNATQTTKQTMILNLFYFSIYMRHNQSEVPGGHVNLLPPNKWTWMCDTV